MSSRAVHMQTSASNRANRIPPLVTIVAMMMVERAYISERTSAALRSLRVYQGMTALVGSAFERASVHYVHV